MANREEAAKLRPICHFYFLRGRLIGAVFSNSIRRCCILSWIHFKTVLYSASLASAFKALKFPLYFFTMALASSVCFSHAVIFIPSRASFNVDAYILIIPHFGRKTKIKLKI